MARIMAPFIPFSGLSQIVPFSDRDKLTYQGLLQALAAKITELVEGFNNYEGVSEKNAQEIQAAYEALAAQVNKALDDLENEYSIKLTNTRKELVRLIISSIESGVALDPTSGVMLGVSDVINNVYDALRYFAFTAILYDTRTYSAEEYDGFEWTAEYYDLYGSRVMPSGPDGAPLVADHAQLVNLDAPNQHAIASITGLSDALDGLSDAIDAIGDTSEGTMDHAQLTNRNIANQHTIAAISGLRAELDALVSGLNGKQPSGSYAYSSRVMEAGTGLLGGGTLSGNRRFDVDPAYINGLINAKVVTTHNGLSGKDEANQHPISAITGLQTELNNAKTARVPEYNGGYGTIKTGDYTIGKSDEHKLLVFAPTDALATVTIPANSAFKVGSRVSIFLNNNNSVQVQGESGVSVKHPGYSTLATVDRQYSTIHLIRLSNTLWIVDGVVKPDAAADSTYRVPNTIALTSYTLTQADRHSFLRFNAFSDIKVTIPNFAESVFPLGTTIAICNVSASSDLTIVGGSGVTIRHSGSTTGAISKKQYGVMYATRVGASEWHVYGDLT